MAILGIAGVCRRDDLQKLTVDDNIEDMGTILTINIRKQTSPDLFVISAVQDYTEESATNRALHVHKVASIRRVGRRRQKIEKIKRFSLILLVHQRFLLKAASITIWTYTLFFKQLKYF